MSLAAQGDLGSSRFSNSSPKRRCSDNSDYGGSSKKFRTEEGHRDVPEPCAERSTELHLTESQAVSEPADRSISHMPDSLASLGMPRSNIDGYFNFSTRCVPMRAYLNRLPVSIHREVHRATQRALREKLEFDIDPRGTARLDADAVAEEAIQQEVPVDGSTVAASVAGVEVDKVLQQATEVLRDLLSPKVDGAKAQGPKAQAPTQRNKPRSSNDAGGRGAGGATARPEGADHAVAKASRPVPGRRRKSLIDEIVGLKQRPIILVPTGPNDLVNDTNVLRFLRDAEFVVSPRSLRTEEPVGLATASGVKPFITRTIRGKPVKFRIVESTLASRFEPAEWMAVVGVILSGPEWQLAGWPFEKTEDIFRSMKGFFFAYTDAPVPPTIFQWNAQVMRLSRNQRHYDGPVQNEFWRTLEGFILLPRQHVVGTRPQHCA